MLGNLVQQRPGSKLIEIEITITASITDCSGERKTASNKKG
jgi:hypothetical protein